MIQTETVYIKGKLVGVLRKDTDSNQIAFSPNSGSSRIPEREWESMDVLKMAVLSAYRKSVYGTVN